MFLPTLFCFLFLYRKVVSFFFFQAEDGIRVRDVTGVQTCALPIYQRPLPNEVVSPTTVVTFAVSLGSDLVEVPDVQRTRLQDAQNRLNTLGFQVQVQEEASTISEGFVIRQDPVDVKLPHGQTVTVVVSIGNKVTMPDVTGKSEAEAKQMIAAAGLTFSFSDVQGCDKLGAEMCSRFPPGTVVSSIPRGNDRVERGSPVTLGVRAP